MRQYVISKAEYQSLLDRLELTYMKENNIGDPGRYLNEEWRKLSDHEKTNMLPAIENIHRSFHYVVVRWAQEMGFEGIRK